MTCCSVSPTTTFANAAAICVLLTWQYPGSPATTTNTVAQAMILLRLHNATTQSASVRVPPGTTTDSARRRVFHRLDRSLGPTPWCSRRRRSPGGMITMALTATMRLPLPGQAINGGPMVVEKTIASVTYRTGSKLPRLPRSVCRLLY